MNFHETIMSTSEPSACSTELRRESKLPLDKNKAKAVRRSLYSSESLGILSLDDMKPTKDTSLITSDNPTKEDLNLNNLEERRIALEHTRALLDKFTNRHNTTNSQCSQTSQLTESTVNEIDLLRESQSTFNTSSHMKYSTINETDLVRQSTLNLSETGSRFLSEQVSNISITSGNNTQNVNQVTSESMSSDSLSQCIEDLKARFLTNTS